jgi:hypothetical protein
MRDPEESRAIGYQVLPYMEHLADAEFAQRVCDIYLNAQLDTPPEVMVKLPPMGWKHLWRDAVDEAYRRFDKSVAQQFLKHVRTSCAAAWHSRKRMTPVLSDDQVATFFRRAHVNGQSFLVRYSTRERLEALVARGQLRIFPATRYDDPSLNPAIRDNELEVTIQPHGLTADVFDTNGKPKGSIRIKDNRLATVSPTNYYVHCVSRFSSLELFPDFNANACVVIRDPKLYASRILDGLHARLPYPTWGGDVEQVKYVDPLNAATRQLQIPINKHFRFAYQQEWRIIWVPVQDAHGLQYIDLELGSMEDCCTLLVP